MYDTAGINHWMAVSEPTCAEGELISGTSIEASKRPCPSSDPEQSVPPRRRYGKCRKSKPASSTESETSHDLAAADEELNSLDTWTILRTLPKSINLRAFEYSNVENKAPLGFKSLLKQVHMFAQGLRIVPAQLKDDLEQHSDDSSSPEYLYYTSSHSRSGLGMSPTLAEVDRIVNTARELFEDGDSEASYESLVHGPLFALALSLSPHAERVAVKNIVQATIAPDSLLPQYANDKAINGGTVDWAVALRPFGTPRGALLRALRQSYCSQMSFNHSRYYPLIDKPIVVSVKTISEGETLRQAWAQLAVWASAHMNFLSRLPTNTDSSATALPHLPLLIIQGSQYSFLFASREIDGSTNIHAKIDIGDASMRYGVFKIISVLLLLIDWAETRYRPWFEGNFVVKE